MIRKGGEQSADAILWGMDNPMGLERLLADSVPSA
jgi:hypothetical protein